MLIQNVYVTRRVYKYLPTLVARMSANCPRDFGYNILRKTIAYRQEGFLDEN